MLRPPATHRGVFRFLLPPSLGREVAAERADRLQQALAAELPAQVEVGIARDYGSMARALLSGEADACWSPPFVCARVEAMGARVVVRGLRHGASTYRAALVGRREARLTLEQLRGKVALWTDRDSVAGYLLATAFLKAKGLDPAKLFFAQEFAGTYRAALEGVLVGRGDLTSVFAPPARSGQAPTTGAVDVLGPDRAAGLAVIAFTDEAPNDGVAVSMTGDPGLVERLESALLGLSKRPEHGRVLREVFNAEGFERAPRNGYRALYRVALASM